MYTSRFDRLLAAAASMALSLLLHASYITATFFFVYNWTLGQAPEINRDRHGIDADFVRY